MKTQPIRMIVGKWYRVTYHGDRIWINGEEVSRDVFEDFIKVQQETEPDEGCSLARTAHSK